MVLVVPLVFLALVIAIKAYFAAAGAERGMTAINEHLAAINHRIQRIDDDLKRVTDFAPPAATYVAPKTTPSPAPARPPSISIPQTLTAPPAPSRAVDVPSVPQAAAQLSTTFESEIGSRWMLLAGVVVLVLGIAFFVKYAFDRHWINETARVGIGTIAGLAVWATG